MKHNNKSILHEPFQELLALQNQLCQQSKYYGALLQQRLGTDTIPFVLMTTVGERLSVNGFCCFRLEVVEESDIIVQLLQGYSVEDTATASFRELMYLTKTGQMTKLPLQAIAAIQLIDVPLQTSLWNEKW